MPVSSKLVPIECDVGFLILHLDELITKPFMPTKVIGFRRFESLPSSFLVVDCHIIVDGCHSRAFSAIMSIVIWNTSWHILSLMTFVRSESNLVVH